ncbi:hypothetical protein GSY69_00570 [Brevibacterium sp. 5221]|uniref:CN hydrolase domain-containing protein n=1 Tax=Brevibacterium rongguiense TaxID=2695267 RepID=A0A6N9H3B4_9MICO|nr:MULTISPECIES: nitrilase-related carbon-nitrogen hydrolase [Brevibacterium]MYM18508.1 hypothetical protein [Brevibacterium rongguiense]WAL39580.1 hypothetical protein BRM1_09915 [Brevibacterium sp. BRM-1]
MARTSLREQATWGIVFLCGGALATATFVDRWWVQVLPLFCIAPVFVAMRRAKPSRHYPAGLVFFGAWLLPTTYWYYSFMPVWLAFLASVGFVALIANLFRLFALRLPFWAVLVLVAAVWSALTFARMHLPVTEDWWLPHLGYAVWRNSGLLQFAALGGEAVVEAGVLASNVVVALLIVSFRPWVAVAGMCALGGAVVVADVRVWDSEPDAVPQVVSVQQMTVGGVDVPATARDIRTLTETSAAALKTLDGDARRIVVWPENSVPEAQRLLVESAARDLDASVVYHSAEMRGDERFKRVIVLNERGDEVLSNTKAHIAPDESGTGAFSNRHVSWADWSITAYVCYDMHYPDSVRRVAGADIVFVPINDAAYGGLQQRFHKADLAIRAVQSRASMISASTNGPTVFIDKHGVVRDELQPVTAGVITVKK